MKSLNCDQVFDVLTRGPFPTGDAIDAPVERHLAGCHECRQLAEALRPAIELFHEAIEPEESRDLPGYHGSLAPSSGGLAQLVAEAIGDDAPAPGSARNAAKRASFGRALLAHQPTQFEAFALAMAVGALFVLSLAGFGALEETPTQRSAAFVPNQERLVKLTNCSLGPTCLSWSPGESMTTLNCCTQCHSPSENKQLSRDNMVIVTASCRACHP